MDMKCVTQIKKGNFESFPILLESFKPLILSWLRKIHQLHTSETEDYISMAKIILLECAETYDARKKVPFQSYYKIKLYNWYGNQMQRKKFHCINIEEAYQHGIDIDFTEEIEKEKNALLLEKSMATLTDQEQDIIKKLLEGQTASEIAKQMKLSKKTILNKKYIIIKKMKIALNKLNH